LGKDKGREEVERGSTRFNGKERKGWALVGGLGQTKRRRIHWSLYPIRVIDFKNYQEGRLPKRGGVRQNKSIKEELRRTDSLRRGRKKRKIFSTWRESLERNVCRAKKEREGTKKINVGIHEKKGRPATPFP